MIHFKYNYALKMQLPGRGKFNVEPAPKSKKIKLDTKKPRHQFTQNIVYQYIKFGEF
jgi:hypothetical protein